MSYISKKHDQDVHNGHKKLVDANTRFALNLLKELQKEDDNIFISPISISTVLAMILNGAEGSTKNAVYKTLQLDEYDLQSLNEGYRDLVFSLKNIENDIDIILVNSIWINKNYAPSIKLNFKDCLKKYYLTELMIKQFEKKETLNEINEWVEKNTYGKIKKIIDDINSDKVLFLISAIFFQGNWTNKFIESKTHKDIFFLQDSGKIEINMMYIENDFFYYTDKYLQVVKLPYGRKKVSMYIFLPEEGVKLESIVSTITQEKIENIISNMKVTDLEIQMPKLKLEYGTKRLNEVLTRLNMGIAFSPLNANFEGISKISHDPLFISFIDHKAVIDVDEKGTEAAATTIIGMARASMFNEVKKLKINRPYLLIIRDDLSGLILFIGKIMVPTQ